MKLLCNILLLALSSSIRSSELEPPSSAELCGRCHRAIFEAWKTSSHAQAMESRLFQDALDLTESNLGAGARKTCLTCHSPIGVATGDLGLRMKVSWEGVTCDYCHSIRNVSLTGVNPKATVAFTLVKSGPLKDASSSAHGTEFSAVHTTALACAPCHEYRNSLGLEVLATFSEWKKSRYSTAGKECQSCHMYRVAGDVVDPHIQRSSLAKINLHQMPGSHSLEQLTRTITAQLSTARKGNQLQVVLDVMNRAAGHYVPTGSPLRRLMLQIRADSSNGRHFREERVYQRVVADQQGKELELEPLVFVKGAKVLSDTRLAPDEKRTEIFSFPIPPGIQTQLTATLKYYYSPMARTESQKQITFLTITRLVR
jgi:hypothetical protein